ncbi:phospholipase D-like domain-containing protein [Thermococcus sp.]|uniref:phospholipase D-like domain-containing protein n=1 Tax=Thermococcus sp. TaxID=35749 RepID=UPI0026113773|nr:phospholipase D-like domain-containing protein [Thermococcus sp.]
MRRIVIGLLLAFIVFTAGCLGGAVDSQSKAPVKTVTKATTITKERTVTKYLAPEKNDSLIENLTNCEFKLNSTASALNSTLKTLGELREKYESCLLQRGREANSSAKIRELEESLSECRLKVESLSEELNVTKTSLEEEREKCSTPPSEVPGSVEFLMDKDYYMSLLSAINSAKSEIYVMMFLMKYDPGDSYDPANDLIRALVKAEQRGVRVHVLLEDGIEENRKAYDYLKQNGVDVTFDSPATTLHAKVVVIDGRIVFIGSHNWSEAALNWNHEVSVRIDSEEFARKMEDYFLRVMGN